MAGRAPLVALLTDFGLGDVFAGVVKAVIAGRCPGVPVVDLTHEVPPGDVVAGAWLLKGAAGYLPPGSVILAVVDPGVGGSRRPICIRAGEHVFVGPDNGILWPAVDAAGYGAAYVLDRRNWWLPQVSATFHGRDIFAPVAAALGCGTPPESVGSPIADPQRLDLPQPRAVEGRVEGTVLWVDRFGNLITNLTAGDIDAPDGAPLSLTIAGRVIEGPAAFYNAGASGELCFVLSSFGSYEVAVTNGSAAAALGGDRGTSVVLERLS